MSLINSKCYAWIPCEDFLDGRFDQPHVILFKPTHKKTIGHLQNDFFRGKLPRRNWSKPGFKALTMYFLLYSVETPAP